MGFWLSHPAFSHKFGGVPRLFKQKASTTPLGKAKSAFTSVGVRWPEKGLHVCLRMRIRPVQMLDMYQ